MPRRTRHQQPRGASNAATEMPTFISRLVLTTGQSLVLGEKWLDVDICPVGLIIERPEESVELEGVSEKTLAHYEVWLLPEALCRVLFEFYHDFSAYIRKQSEKKPDTQKVMQEVRKEKNLVCRRISASMAAFTEEVFPVPEALVAIHEFFAEKIELPEEAEAPPDAQRTFGELNGPNAR